MMTDDQKPELPDEQDVTWSSHQQIRHGKERRDGIDRRQMSGRMITVPDMRSGYERRNDKERRKVKLIITGRAMDV